MLLSAFNPNSFASAYLNGSSGESWAIIIGVSDYLHSNILYMPDLEYCDDDAIGLSNMIVPTWGADHVCLLIDSNASKTNIHAAIFDWLAPAEDVNDTVLFFFSGHGAQGSDVAPADETDSKDEYICPYDSLIDSYANDIRDDELDEWLNVLESGRIAVMLETCHSGGFIGSLGTIKAEVNRIGTSEVAPAVESLGDGFVMDISKGGRVILAACAEDGSSYQYSSIGHSVFSYYVIDALGNLETVDANADKQIAAEEIFDYAAPLTRAFAESKDHPQSPQLYDGYDGDLPLIEGVQITFDVSSQAASLIVDSTTYAHSLLPKTFLWAKNTTHTFNVSSMAYLAESPHPYPTYYNNTWNIMRLNASQMKIHFDYIRTEKNYDSVQILNGTDDLYASYSGNYTDVWSEWVPGDTIKIRLTSDFSICYDGFLADGLQYVDSNDNLTKEFERYVFSSWDDGNTSISRTLTVTSPQTYNATFNTEYYLTIDSPYSSKSGEGWYEEGTIAYANLVADTFDHENGTRRLFTHWSGDAAGTDYGACDPIYMDSAKTAIANWKTQYQLNVTSLYGDVEGSGWYDENTNAYASVTSTTVPVTTGVQYAFTSWSNAASGTTSTSSPILMDNPKSATANWKIQYKVSFAVGSAGGGTTMPSGDIWVDEGSSPITISASASSGYRFSSWSAPVGIAITNTQASSTTAKIAEPGTITANFIATSSDGGGGGNGDGGNGGGGSGGGGTGGGSDDDNAIVESKNEASLTIYVCDLDSKPLEGVTVVSISQPEGQKALKGTTNSSGYVTFNDVAAGSYMLQASKNSYFNNKVQATVQADKTASATIELQSETVKPSEPLPIALWQIAAVILTSAAFSAAIAFFIRRRRKPKR